MSTTMKATTTIHWLRDPQTKHNEPTRAHDDTEHMPWIRQHAGIRQAIGDDRFEFLKHF
jgi:hypothetical protein